MLEKILLKEEVNWAITTESMVFKNWKRGRKVHGHFFPSLTTKWFYRLSAKTCSEATGSKFVIVKKSCSS